ncbi:MAG: TrmH family RNA methyltransferase [Porphyromonas sp.]|nr:TrmH family RNA methyltransferase [Porphyromonas sp.]
MGQKYSIEELHRLSPEEYQEAEKLPIVVVLDNVRSLYNVGSFFRTVDALGAEGLLLCGITGTPPHVEVHKSALGAEEVVRWQHVGVTADAVEELHRRGYQVWAVEQARGSVDLADFGARCSLKDCNGIALVFGHEVEGVQQEVVDACDGCIELAQYGTKHSMNVSVTGGIVLWEIARVWRKERKRYE